MADSPLSTAWRRAVLAAVLGVGSLAPLTVFAQTDDPPPGATRAGRPAGGGGARWSLGAGVIVAPRPYVGADAEIQPIPILEFYSGRWFVQGIRAGYRFVDTESIDFDIRARIRFSGLDPDDSPFLDGMEERRETVEVGLGLDWELARALGGAFELELRAFADVLGRSDGFESSIDLGWRRVLGPGKAILLPAVGMVYQSSDQVDYYYGVRPEEALPGRPVYEGSAVFNPRASVLFVYRFTQRWSLTTLASVDFFDDEIKSSPIIDQSSELFGLIGLAYSF
jgi:outer membrane protein